MLLDFIFRGAQSYIVILTFVVHGGVLVDVERSLSAASLAEDYDATDSQEGKSAHQHSQEEQTNSGTNSYTCGAGDIRFSSFSRFSRFSRFRSRFSRFRSRFSRFSRFRE